MYNDTARYVGEAVHKFAQHSGNTERKPVLIGFASLPAVDRFHKIRDQTHEINTKDERVRFAVHLFVDKLIWLFRNF